MDPTRKNGLYISVVILICTASNFSAYLPDTTDNPSNSYVIIRSMISALKHPDGHTFNVRWTYEIDNESWTGDGTLSILGVDYLKLTIPYQEVLIQKSTISIKYFETGQVIIDYFDREDPSNIFAIFMGELDWFAVDSMELPDNDTVSVTLSGKSLVGFDRLNIDLEKTSWLPIYIYAQAGDDIKISIYVDERTQLENPESLIRGSLSGNEIIDLRW